MFLTTAQPLRASSERGGGVIMRKIDTTALILFFIFIISIVTFLVGVIIKNPISLIGAILYYLLVFYILIVGWMGGFE